MLEDNLPDHAMVSCCPIPCCEIIPGIFLTQNFHILDPSTQVVYPGAGAGGVKEHDQSKPGSRASAKVEGTRRVKKVSRKFKQ